MVLQELGYTTVAPVPAVSRELHIYLRIDFNGMLYHDLEGFKESHEKRPILCEFFGEVWAPHYVEALPRAFTCARGCKPHRVTGPF